MRFSALFLAFFTAFVWGGTGVVPHVDRALAASFLPARFRVADTAVRARLVELLRKQPQDSVARFTWEGDELQISADMAARLGAGSDTAKKFHSRVRRTLEKLAGSEIEEVQTLFADAYYPNDPSFVGGPQWALYNTGATLGGVAGKVGVDLGMTKVWEKFDGDDSLVIAVVDAGFNFNHPDLKGRWYRNMKEVNGIAGVDDDGNGVVDDTAGWDFVNNDNLPQDYLGHGSEVSGIIAGNFDNNAGVAGMIPRARILPVRVLDAVGSGSVTNVANGILYAAKMKVSAINFSVGGGGTSALLQNAFKAARDSGIPIIAAAGNDSVNLDANPVPPSNYGYNNVFMVAAHNQAGAISHFSAYGAKSVSIAAPGENIVVTGVPSPTGVAGLLQFNDNFDGGITNWTFAAVNDFGFSATNPFTAFGEPGLTSLIWKATASTWASTTNFIDLTGKSGSTIWFLLDFTPANTTDQLIVEGQIENSTTWNSFATITGRVTPQWLSFDTHAVDGKRFKLRFRTSATGTLTARKITLDDIRIYYYDSSPTTQATAYFSGAGTSFAAPYMTSYVALARTAAKRMGRATTGNSFRSLVLDSGAAVKETAFTGKDSTGGRLDVSKGLAFYLKTLPSLLVKDSAKTSWNVGDVATYNLSVTPSATYTYSDVVAAALSNSTLTSAGVFSWNTNGKTVGLDTVRFRADKSPLVLRKMIAFTLNPKSTGISSAYSASGNLLWVGDRTFILPPNFFQVSRHDLRIESIEADGRSRVVFSGEMETPPASGKTGWQFSDLTGLGWRVWVDGTALAFAARK